MARKAECGFLTVPLDHAKPAGPTIQLAVSRARHAVPDAVYQGVMLVNPGGPGVRAGSVGARCAAAGGTLLDHLKTTDSVADLESLREACGVPQINYYGFSYGTYLG